MYSITSTLFLNSNYLNGRYSYCYISSSDYPITSSVYEMSDKKHTTIYRGFISIMMVCRWRCFYA